MKRWMLLAWLPFLLGSGNERPEPSPSSLPITPTCAFLMQDCSDGIPRLDCSIWKITYAAEMSTDRLSASVTCESDGNMRCDPVSIAQGLVSFLKNLKPD